MSRIRPPGSPFILGNFRVTEFKRDTEVVPSFIVTAGPASGSAKWYGAWGKTPKGREFGYIHTSTVSQLVPIEVTAGPPP